jgi:hypothetical protein
MAFVELVQTSIVVIDTTLIRKHEHVSMDSLLANLLSLIMHLQTGNM